MSNSSLVALLIAISMVLWVLSGDFSTDGIRADETATTDIAAIQQASGLSLVRGIQSEATEQSTFLAVRGQTRANRVVDVKSEISGVVNNVPGEKGTFVKAGELLCEVAVDSRQSDLAEARANLTSAKLEFDGISDLNKQGLQSQINLAKAKAALEQSRSAAKRAELALQKTRILAPFNGVVEAQPVEVGDFMTPGTTCVTLMEIDPVLVVGRLAEKDVTRVKQGDRVIAKLINDQTFDAEITFIGRSPDPVTRTYEIEASVASPGTDIRAGMTASMQVPTGVKSAHLISSAALVLSDEGIIGVRTVDARDQVRFLPVEVVSEGPQGVWISGLPKRTNIITIGQEEVFEGQIVEIDFTPLSAVVSN